MATVVHNIDPDADTIIVLKNPLSQSAIDELGAEEPASREEVSDDDSSHEEVHYHVSSSHLRLGSPHFRRMLSGENWQEGIPNENDGRHHINVEDWDPEALLIFLNVLHLRNRHVPRSISLGILVKIALLVNYYDCTEAFELSAEIWIKDLKSTTCIPSEPCRNLMLWIFIAWVFSLPAEFAQTTTVAIKRSKQDLLISDLPISHIVDSIDEARNQAISVIVSNLKNLLEKFRSTDYKCPFKGHYDNYRRGYHQVSPNQYSFECGSMLYGALTKGLDSLGLMAPYTSTSFPDTSFQEIYSKACNIKSPKWYSSVEHNPSLHSCSLNAEVKPMVDEVMNSIKGLDLRDFRRT